MSGQRLGVETPVRFTTWNKSIKAKVDTGADLSSIHAENISVSGGRVSFRCPQLSSNIITVPLTANAQVRNADGQTGNRPVIKTQVEIHGKVITAEFTLNDRGSNTYQCLVGKNILSAGGFVVDASVKESGQDMTVTIQPDPVPQAEVPQGNNGVPNNVIIPGDVTKDKKDDIIKKIVNLIDSEGVLLSDIVKEIERRGAESLDKEGKNNSEAKPVMAPEQPAMNQMPDQPPVQPPTSVPPRSV